MKTSLIGRAVTVLLVGTTAFSVTLGFDGKHQPLRCGFPSYGGAYRPKEINDIQLVPPSVREFLALHIATRVGSQFFEDISFERGQIVDVRELHRVDPESKQYKWQVPSYNLIYQLRLPGTGIFRGCILLDENGALIQELTMPAWGRAESAVPLTSLERATVVARQNGAHESGVTSTLDYFPDTDTLEWLFEWTTWDDGLEFGGKTLHVPIQAPAHVHWSTWRAIR